MKIFLANPLLYEGIPFGSPVALRDWGTEMSLSLWTVSIFCKDCVVLLYNTVWSLGTGIRTQNFASPEKGSLQIDITKPSTHSGWPAGWYTCF